MCRQTPLQYLLHVEFTDLTWVFQYLRKILHPSVTSRTITGFLGTTIFLKHGSRLCYLTFNQPVVTPWQGCRWAGGEVKQLLQSWWDYPHLGVFCSIRFLTRKVIQLFRPPYKLPQLSCFLKGETRCTFLSSVSQTSANSNTNIHNCCQNPGKTCTFDVFAKLVYKLSLILLTE